MLINLSTIVGLALVIIALLDIYLTVLHPRIDSTLIGAPLAKVILMKLRNHHHQIILL